MVIVPVIDLKDGVVVRGVAGRRQEYRPIKTQIASDPQPGTVARGIADHFAPETIYVADLDAILGGRPNLSAYGEITAVGMRIWLDAGIGDLAAAQRLRASLETVNVHAEIVIGLESLSAPESLDQVVIEMGPRHAIFSLDLHNGKPLSRIASWQTQSPLSIAEEAVAQGIERMILLDLADVGSRQGVSTLDLCRELRARHPGLELIAGGGVRGVRDLNQLAAAGASAALVASALHDGRLTREDLRCFASASGRG